MTPQLKNSQKQAFPGLFSVQLSAGFSSRDCGNMSLNYGQAENSPESRRHFLAELGINYRSIVCAKQVHGCRIRRARSQDAGKGALSYDTAIADTDALITDEKNLALAVFIADCLSVFLYDAKHQAIGLVHAGWRGSQENILAKSLKAMENEFATQGKDIYAAFGPAIRSCCYEVGEEFKQNFPAGLIEENGRLFLDLVQTNRKQLLDFGASEANIFDCGICTCCQNQDYFSFRKEGASCGRMISVMMLK
jgi:YfiH family protein